jgi:membrane protease YdiL (CAAX protease family)
VSEDDKFSHDASRVEPDLPPDRPSPTPAQRTLALLEVGLCSGYPTQIALAATLAALGLHLADRNGRLRIASVAALELVDAAAVIGLVLLFLASHRERARDLFVDARPLGREALAGLALIPAALAIAIAVLVTVRVFAPALHTVPRNPLLDLLDSRSSTVVFGVVVVVAGGVREEVQRAFLLSRFERWLGGAPLGIAVGSVLFGIGHLVQGVDAAVATTCLAVFWGLIYLRRRSIVAPVVSHAGFNLLQLAQYLIFRTSQ